MKPQKPFPMKIWHLRMSLRPSKTDESNVTTWYMGAIPDNVYFTWKKIINLTQ